MKKYLFILSFLFASCASITNIDTETVNKDVDSILVTKSNADYEYLMSKIYVSTELENESLTYEIDSLYIEDIYTGGVLIKDINLLKVDINSAKSNVQLIDVVKVIPQKGTFIVINYRVFHKGILVAQTEYKYKVYDSWKQSESYEYNITLPVKVNTITWNPKVEN